MRVDATAFLNLLALPVAHGTVACIVSIIVKPLHIAQVGCEATTTLTADHVDRTLEISFLHLVR